MKAKEIMDENYSDFGLFSLLLKPPQAAAVIQGSEEYPDIRGDVYFYQLWDNVFVMAEVTGLPVSEGDCQSPVFGFHIHEGESCSGNSEDAFADAMAHYNPHGCPHPYHSGDLPPLFGNDGYAFCAFITNRFTVSEIVGRTVIIHGKPDDFTTQPSGNAGKKIACGQIS